jgi:hypothetical protein
VDYGGIDITRNAGIVEGRPKTLEIRDTGMAGLGLFNQKSARALAPRGLLRSAYDFLCLVYAKSAKASWKVPGQF